MKIIRIRIEISIRIVNSYVYSEHIKRQSKILRISPSYRKKLIRILIIIILKTSSKAKLKKSFIIIIKTSLITSSMRIT